MPRRKTRFPKGFEEVSIELQGALRERGGSNYILVPFRVMRMYALRTGDEVVATVVAIRKQPREEEAEA